MRIAVAGAGAFGTALAVVLCSAGAQVTVVGRDAQGLEDMRNNRVCPKLPGATLPISLRFSTHDAVFSDADIVLLATPAQTLRTYIEKRAEVFADKLLVACCKGIDIKTLSGPAEIIANTLPGAEPAILTGPSFAADIALGLPTALTLACAHAETGAWLQSALSAPTLRLYTSTDVMGAQLGGALKNVMAIACGATIGAGLGDSARAALMTRGFSEMTRLAVTLGARSETLGGLSGLGDLALTCTSDLSRNFRYGHALGAKTEWDAATTVEGASTAQAALDLARKHGLDLPVTETVAGLVSGRITVDKGLETLLSRPLKEE